MKITKKSPLTGNKNTMDLDVTQEQLDAHAAGAYAQDVFGHLSKEDREFLISGITPKEWADYFGQLNLETKTKPDLEVVDQGIDEQVGVHKHILKGDKENLEDHLNKFLKGAVIDNVALRKYMGKKSVMLMLSTGDTLCIRLEFTHTSEGGQFGIITKREPPM